MILFAQIVILIEIGGCYVYADFGFSFNNRRSCRKNL